MYKVRLANPFTGRHACVNPMTNPYGQHNTQGRRAYATFAHTDPTTYLARKDCCKNCAKYLAKVIAYDVAHGARLTPATGMRV